MSTIIPEPLWERPMPHIEDEDVYDYEEDDE
jgi:hypothetical protein